MTHMADTWIRLLGPPRIESAGTAPRQPRGRKAWAVLAYLALQPDGTGRARTAALLFPDAEDPLGALRWNLSELRRTLGARLGRRRPAAAGAAGRAGTAMCWSWPCGQPATAGPRARFDGQLLEGLSFADSPVFESWLEDQRHRLENCVLVAALRGVARPRWRRAAADDAVDLATRALRLDPFNADCTRRAGQGPASPWASTGGRGSRSTSAADLYRRELGLGAARGGAPGAVRRGRPWPSPGCRPVRPRCGPTSTPPSASLSAGSVDRGLDQLRLAVGLAQRTD